MGKSARQSQAVNEKFDSTTGKAAQAEAEAGTDDSQWMSSLNVKDAYSQYGLGKTIASSETLNDTLVNGFFRYTSVDPDSDGASGAFATFVNSPAAVHQIAFQNYTNNIRTRNKNNSDVWSDWVAFYHTGNFLHLQNSSGASILSNSTTAGSNLTPAQSGTWKNVSAVTINNGDYGLWKLV